MSMTSLSIASISARYSFSVTGILAERSSSKNWKNMGVDLPGQANGGSASLARVRRPCQRGGRSRCGRRNRGFRRDYRSLRRRCLGDVDQRFGEDGIEEIALLVVVARRGEFDRRLDRPVAD